MSEFENLKREIEHLHYAMGLPNKVRHPDYDSWVRTWGAYAADGENQAWLTSLHLDPEYRLEVYRNYLNTLRERERDFRPWGNFIDD